MNWAGYSRRAISAMLSHPKLAITQNALIRDAITAVSYTHLDVYKRQFQDFLAIKVQTEPIFIYQFLPERISINRTSRHFHPPSISRRNECSGSLSLHIMDRGHPAAYWHKPETRRITCRRPLKRPGARFSPGTSDRGVHALPDAPPFSG